MPKEIRIPIYSFKNTELAKNMSVVHVFEDWAPQKDFIISQNPGFIEIHKFENWPTVPGILPGTVLV